MAITARIPWEAARLSIFKASSISLAPSSTPGRMWAWTSIILSFSPITGSPLLPATRCRDAHSQKAYFLRINFFQIFSISLIQKRRKVNKKRPIFFRHSLRKRFLVLLGPFSKSTLFETDKSSKAKEKSLVLRLKNVHFLSYLFHNFRQYFHAKQSLPTGSEAFIFQRRHAERL